MKNRLLTLCLTLSACSSPESTGIATVSCPADSTLTYENFGSPLLTDNCLSCHAARQSPVLGTQAQVQANASRILQAAVYTTVMPDGGSMATAERALLGEWLACGAP
jgi:uncharacterized membrane protein